MAPDLEGRPYSVKYHELPALLLNQAQKDHRSLEGLEARVETLQQVNAELRARLDELERELAARSGEGGGGGGGGDREGPLSSASTERRPARQLGGCAFARSSRDVSSFRCSASSP